MLSIVLAGSAFAPQLTPPQLHTAGRAAVFASAEGAERKFARAPNLLDLGDEKVTARQIVNVLGRWTTHTQWWEGIGVSVNLEAILNDPSKMAELKPMSEAVRTKSGNLRRALSPEEKAARSPARTPARRAFCNRNNLVQRWVHSENVGLLPFTDEAMAASVGATAAELDAEPIDKLAAEIVFDALSASQSGVCPIDDCNARRASYTDAATGGFDADAFAAGLRRAKLNICGAYAVYPGALNLVMLGVAIKLDAYHLGLDALQEGKVNLLEQWERTGVFSLAFPAVIAAVLSWPKPAETASPTGDPWERGIPKVAPKAAAEADDDLAAKLEGALPMKVEAIEAKDGAASQ